MAILKGKVLYISYTKTEYLKCNFSDIEQDDGPEVTIAKDVVTALQV